jgi:cytochrome b561
MDVYSGASRALHWMVAILILAMIPAGVVMVQDGLPRGLQNTLFIFHKNVGVAVLLLMLARLAWRLARPAPPLPDTLPLWQKRVARATHGGLYALALFVPVAGYVRVKAGGFPIETLDAMGIPALVPRSDALAEAAKAAHYAGGLALSGLVALHVGAALYHAQVKRDGVFGRIWPPIGPARASGFAPRRP